ncbi:MAG: hypothetical protein KGL39_17415 [Patescibacteria group bacterium]|nr:hypothetical protein [Patescibacteria group bacterium]
MTGSAKERRDPKANLQASQGSASPISIQPNAAQLILLQLIASGLRLGDATGAPARITEAPARITDECRQAKWLTWDAQDKTWALTDTGRAAMAGGAR